MIVIFIPTPLVGRATGLIAGFFIWLTAWGITDAVTHEAATSYGYKVFENIRQAKNTFGETAQAGRYTVSRNAEGDVVAFHSETGGRFNVMGFTKHVETVIGPHNIKGKREEYRKAGFHNVSDSRMMNLSRGNMIASEVYDQKGNLIHE